MNKISYPFEGKYNISQNFGDNPATYKPMGYAGHFGVDFLTPWGTPILACDDGEVAISDFSNGNGYFVELKHAWGSSLYLHFKEASTVKVGDVIKKGQIIGYAGNTGNVISSRPMSDQHRGTHLHFSIKINGKENQKYKNFIDPIPYLTNEVVDNISEIIYNECKTDIIAVISKIIKIIRSDIS